MLVNLILKSGLVRAKSSLNWIIPREGLCVLNLIALPSEFPTSDGVLFLGKTVLGLIQPKEFSGIHLRVYTHGLS